MGIGPWRTNSGYLVALLQVVNAAALQRGRAMEMRGRIAK